MKRLIAKAQAKALAKGPKKDSRPNRKLEYVLLELATCLAVCNNVTPVYDNG